jgi:hypothetical protein
MSKERKKPTASFWITVALVAVLVAYPLTFGPACWLAARTQIDRGEMFQNAYWPLGRAIHTNVPVVADLLQAIARIGMPTTGGVVLPGGPKKGEAYHIVLFRDGPPSRE